MMLYSANMNIKKADERIYFELANRMRVNT